MRLRREVEDVVDRPDLLAQADRHSSRYINREDLNSPVVERGDVPQSVEPVRCIVEMV